MQEFLGASKAFFTEKWAYIYRNYGHENFFVMYIVGKFILSLPFTSSLSSFHSFSSSVTTIYSLLIYTLANMIFLFVDLTGKPAFFKRYKIQEDKNFPVSALQYSVLSLFQSILIIYFLWKIISIYCWLPLYCISPPLSCTLLGWSSQMHEVY